MARIRRKKLFCYGFLAWPMAFIGLSLFVFIPKIYHEQYGVSLFVIGSIFLLTKVINLATLPFIGLWLDRLSLRKVYRKKIIYICLPFMALFFHFLIFPPFESSLSVVFFYLVTCALYSIIAINYYAMSVEITRDYRAQNRLSGAREMFTLLGFLTATLFATTLTDKFSFRDAYNEIIFMFIAVLFTAGILLHFVKCKASFIFHPEISMKRLWRIASSAKQSKFLAILLLNGISQGLIATTALFYIKYVIGAEHEAGSFLMAYYLSAIISIPFWIKFSMRNGKKNCWLLSMAFASFLFLSCFFLGTGDTFEFMVICVATGVCLGADIMLSPSIYSDNVEKQEKASSYYSLWILMSKLSMTICVIFSLAILGFYGLEAGSLISVETHDQGTRTLSVMFCLLPALFKLLSMVLLFSAKVDIKFSKEKEDDHHHHDHHHHEDGIVMVK